jgi:hypothetical protein
MNNYDTIEDYLVEEHSMSLYKAKEMAGMHKLTSITEAKPNHKHTKLTIDASEKFGHNLRAFRASAESLELEDTHETFEHTIRQFRFNTPAKFKGVELDRIVAYSKEVLIQGKPEEVVFKVKLAD